MSIENRLAALERSARRWRVAALLLAVGMVAAIGLGAAKDKPIQDEVRTRKLVVVDDKGEAVGLLLSDGKQNMLTLKSGAAAITFSVASDGVGMLTTSPNGSRGFGMLVADQGSTFSLVTKGREQIQMGGGKAGAFLKIEDANDKTVWTARP